MILVPVGRGKSTRSATGEGSGLWVGVAAPFSCVLMGGGVEGPPAVSASLYGLRPQTALRRTLDPSPSGVFSGAEHRPPGSWGAFSGR